MLNASRPGAQRTDFDGRSNAARPPHPRIGKPAHPVPDQIRAAIPEHIRGYGHVKEAHLHKAKAREAELLKKYAG